MPVAVGIDVAKEVHWAAIKIAETGKVLASRGVDNTPDAIDELIDAVRAARLEHGPVTVGIDILGGIATLLEAMLLNAGLPVVHVPGLAVNRARRATPGGEHKSDPKDASVIADQVRMRDDLRPVTALRELDVELRLLVGRRSEIVADQTRRASRTRDLLVAVHPELERAVDVTTKIGMHLLTRYVTPGEIRSAGRTRLRAHLTKSERAREVDIHKLTEAASAAAARQHLAVPGESVAADLIRDLAAEALAGRQQLKAVNARIEAVLADHPDAALIRTLPGMGATLTAEFLAVTGGITRFPSGDQLAAAAGLAPVLKQSGKVRYLQRATAGDKALKRVFYQSAFIATSCDATSRIYYQRKRSEGKAHHQAVLALARRRVNVLHAILRNRCPYQNDRGHPIPAASA